ncbi:prenyltransferase and squalene oxidase repeat protein, partial [delta proteobacterium NaphS2]
MKQRIRTALRVFAKSKNWSGYPSKFRLTRFEEKDADLPVTPLFAVERLNEAIRKAKDRFLKIQNEKGYWVFDLEADTTIPSEYILLQRFLGHEIPEDLKRRIAAYLRNRQLENGGWPLYHEGEANISASVKSYFALKQLGGLSRCFPYGPGQAIYPE